MKLGGLQKLTLLDFPSKVACTVFTIGCNYRCPFCHNASLATHPDLPELSQKEFFNFLKKRQGLLDGVCVTGGEPLLHSDVEDFIKEIHSLGYMVKLDTNGSFPEKLRQLLDDGLLDYVAMDIKNSLEKYPLTVGCNPSSLAEKVKESVSILKSQNTPFEFRTTVVKQLHTEEDFESIGKWLGPVDKYFLQNFVDSGDLIDKTMTGCSEEEMKKFLKSVRKFIPQAQLRGI